MNTNATATRWPDSISLYLVGTTSLLSIIVSTSICLIIVAITYITPNLHSPTNLLVSNTCLCTLLYSIISTINTLIFFTGSISTDWSCRIRGYLGYVTLNLVIYSYIIQAISRLFWTVLYKYRYLLTIKCHRYLIISQISLSFLFPLSSIITKDITYRPFDMCLVPLKDKIHVFYLLTIAYIIPLITVVILYTIIYRHIIRSTSNFRRSLHGTKRDRELARNILILLGIFAFGGVPTVVYIIISSKIESVPRIIFLLATAAPSISVAIEKIVTIMLNKDIRKALIKRWIESFPSCLTFSNRVQPIAGVNNANTKINGTVSRMHPIATVANTQ